MRSTIVVAIICACFAIGQQTLFPLETLKVQGNRRISSNKIVEVSGLKIGVPAVKADFDAARNRLLATGAFESVGCEYKPSPSKKGYAGVIEVVEVEQIYPYRFEELSIPDEKLRKAALETDPILGSEIPATKEVLDRYTAIFHKLTGPDVKVTAKLISGIDGKYFILFRPDTPRAHVAEVRFSGNEVISSGELQRAFADVAFGTTYSESTIRTMLDAGVRPLYDARGRIRVSFPKIETEPAKDYEGVIVHVTIDEGPSYSLGGVEFAGVSKSDAAELKKIANLEQGHHENSVANFDDVKAALEKIYARYRTKGYLRVSGTVEREIDDKARGVNVTLTIDPGPQFTMGKLEIAGLDIISEPEIRKVWSIKHGAPFEPQYPEAFLKDLRDQGVFDNLGKTRAETTIDEKSHVVDVTLYFAGAGPKEKKNAWPGPIPH